MFSLSNRVLGVIDDAREAGETVRDLDQSGVPDGAVETLCGGAGVERIDVRGEHGSRIARLIRAVESVNPQGEQLRHYKDELEQGHCVIDVPVYDEAKRNQAVQILQAHGAHFITSYGQWTAETKVG
jgi:hypothetical protein